MAARFWNGDSVERRGGDLGSTRSRRYSLLVCRAPTLPSGAIGECACHQTAGCVDPGCFEHSIGGRLASRAERNCPDLPGTRANGLYGKRGGRGNRDAALAAVGEWQDESLRIFVRLSNGLSDRGSGGAIDAVLRGPNRREGVHED